jgi:hypothetical protein
MRTALRHPTLSAAAGVGALFAFTWPLLAFERPLYVVVAFFAIWAALIGLLFVFSRASDPDDGAELEGARKREGPDARSD